MKALATVALALSIAIGFGSDAVGQRPIPTGKVSKDDCVLEGKKLYGKVKVVDAFADFEVKKVDAFADLHVQAVTAFPDKCGRWQYVDAFPDFTVKWVDAFEDFSIKTVTAFPGVP